MIGNYWNIDALSNSELSSLAKAYNALPVDMPENLEGTLNFGSLVDGMLTEPWKIDRIMLALTQDDGSLLKFTRDIFEFADRLAAGCKADPLISAMLKLMVGQYVFVRTLEGDHDGFPFAIRGKCKFDLFGKTISTGCDFKTTACTTEKAFREAVDYFHWDRQAAFYMDLARINRHWIIGISKINGKIFKVAIERGDKLFERGKAKYSFWCHKYDILNLKEFSQPQTSIV
jgi:hypothetical protein